MKEIKNNLIDFIKQQKVHGCIAGSSMISLEWDDADVDLFLYDKSSFIKMYYTLKHNDMFLILDELHQWSSENLEEDIDRQFRKNRIISIKFMYNTCVPINIVWKNEATNIYGVLSSFDMSIIAKGYDLLTKKEMDLTEGTTITKIVNWNIYSPKFYKSDIWTMKSILRQFVRVVKYHNRGYNVDLVVKHYISIIDDIHKMNNACKSKSFGEILATAQKETKVVKQICETWLKTHKITEEEIELLQIAIKEM